MNNSVYPCLWFEQQAAQAAAYYCNLFPNSGILEENPMVAMFTLNGTKIMGLNGGPRHRVNPAISYFVYCGSEAEIDRLYAELSREGTIRIPLGQYDWSERYAWVEDKFGG